MTTPPFAPICDFCYVPDVRWQYHTHEFGIAGEDAVFGDTPIHDIQGVAYVSFDDLHPQKTGPSTVLGKDWLVCDQCADCIEHHHLAPLSQRVLPASLKLAPPEQHVNADALREQLRLFCQAFLHQRTTPRTPWPPIP